MDDNHDAKVALNPGALSISASKFFAEQQTVRTPQASMNMSISSLADFKSKAPEYYNEFMKMINQNLIRDVKHRHDNVIKRMKEQRRQGG